MRSVSFMAGALVAAFGLTPSAATATERRPDSRAAVRACAEGPPIARTTQAYVVHRGRATWGRLYGCDRRTGRATGLYAGDEFTGVSWGHLRMAGRFVSFTETVGDGVQHFVSIVDLRHGRRCGIHTAGADPVRGLTVTRWGAAAYAAGTTIVLHDAGGKHVFADAPDVEPRSLQVEGAHVTWTQGGIERSARLSRRLVHCGERRWP